MKRLSWIGVLALCAGCAETAFGPDPFPGIAEEPAVKLPAAYTCHRTIDEITIDGRLDEQSWAKAASTGNLWLTMGDAPSPLPTRAKMVWDDTMLYIAFECADTDIYATFTKRDDALYNQDVVEVFISEQSRGKGHFLEYEFSPLGALFDSYVIKPFRGKTDWDSSALAAAGRVCGTLNRPGDTDRGYVIEIAIPLVQLWQDEFTPPIKEGTKIRLNLYRIDYTTPKKLGGAGGNPTFIAFSPTKAINFHMPERFGTVTFSTQPVGK